MTIKEQFISEIKERIALQKDLLKRAEDSARIEGSIDALQGLLNSMDTLSEEPDNDASIEASASYDTQECTPSPSVDIGDIARVQFAAHAKVFDKKRKAVFDWEQFKEVAGIFYGFGKKDSPETKEKEEPDKSLEEEVKNYFQGYWPGTETVEQCNTDLHFTPPAIIRLARHFAEWQKEQDTRDMFMSDNRHFNKVYELGKKDMKEQMLKDAVDVQVVGEQRDLRLINSTQRCLFDAKRGDWLEIIIVKEEKK